MEHSFNTMAAQEVGLIPAVLLNHIYFWVTKNKADGCNCYDNQYWTRMSKKGFLQYFSYLTERQGSFTAPSQCSYLFNLRATILRSSISSFDRLFRTSLRSFLSLLISLSVNAVKLKNWSTGAPK